MQCPLIFKKKNIHLEGLASLPTYHRGNGLQQYLYVNGRAVKDKMLTGVLRAAYAEHLARDRHPICVLFLTLPFEDVDVNVHPTKAEVRFKNADHVRGLIISSIRHAISDIGHRASNHTTQQAVSALQKDLNQQISVAAPTSMAINAKEAETIEVQENKSVFMPAAAPQAPAVSSPMAIAAPIAAPQSRLPLSVPRPALKSSLMAQTALAHFIKVAPPQEVTETEHPTDIPPMGYAKGQVHETYIIAQTDQDMIIVDQHAAHERIILEKVKAGLKTGGLKSQNLLIPEIVTLGEDLASLLSGYAEALAQFGLIIESFGVTQILVRSVRIFDQSRY